MLSAQEAINLIKECSVHDDINKNQFYKKELKIKENSEIALKWTALKRAVARRSSLHWTTINIQKVFGWQLIKVWIKKTKGLLYTMC